MPFKDADRRREFHRKWAAARRQAFFRGKKCALCPSKRNLELDHVDPRKKVTHRIWSWSRKRRERELKKCQILCRRCHRRKTNAENRARRWPLVHGTAHAYKTYACRCSPCRAANAKHMRDWRRKSGRH